MLHLCYVIWKFKSPNSFTKMGGAEKQLLKLLYEFRSYQNVKVTVIARKTTEDKIYEQFSSNIKIYRVYTTNIPLVSMFLFMIFMPLLIIYLNSKNRITSIQLQLPDVYIFSISLLRNLLKIPVITRVAGDELYPIKKRGLWLADRLFVRHYMLKMDAIQVLTSYSYNLALKLGVEKNKIFLIPNGVEIPKKRRNYSQLNKKILYVGVIEFFPDKQEREVKNLVYLIDAFKETVKYIYDLQLILVGDGNYRRELMNYTKKIGLPDKVKFLGYQTDVLKYLLKADIFINPSHSEGMPNAVLEAMAAGVYVLCSNIPQHTFIIKENVYGDIINHTDVQDFVKKVRNFYENPDFYIKKANKAFSMVKNKLSISKTAAKILEMHKSVSKSFFYEK